MIAVVTRPIVLKLMCVIVLVAMLAVPARAQGNITLNIDGLQSVSGQTMQALVTVRDENGVPISGLGPANFAIVEDQKTFFPPSEVTTRVNPEARLSVALVIDLSSNMRGQPLVEAKAASQKLLDALLSQANDTDRGAFFGINGPVDLNDLAIRTENSEVGFTNDRNAILNTINAQDVPGDQVKPTPLYDALFRVVKLVSRQAGPRAIVVLTDGQDPKVSKLSADDPISEANRNNIPIFPIGFSRTQIDEAYLGRLAARTGGAYTRAGNAAEFGTVFQDILNQVSQQYVLTYQSQLKPDAQPHAVIIRVGSPKGKASDDEVFLFKDVPTAAPTAPVPTRSAGQRAATAAPTVAAPPTRVAVVDASKPSAAATPAAAKGALDKLKDFAADRKNLPVLLALIAALTLVLLLLIVLILRRSRQHDALPEPDAVLPAVAPINRESPTARSDGYGPPATTAGGGVTSSDTYPPTALGGQAPFSASSTPQPPDLAPGFSGDAGPGQTVIVRRGAQANVAAVLVNPRQPQQRYDVTPVTDIGRAQGNNVVLQSGSVSRQHARIREEAGEYRVFDLGSANGTFVNDQKVADPIVLQDGDRVRFGEVEFVFRRLV